MHFLLGIQFFSEMMLCIPLVCLRWFMSFWSLTVVKSLLVSTGGFIINHQLRQLFSKLLADLALVWHDPFPIRFQHKHPQKSRLLISSLMNCNAYRTNLWSRFQNSISFTICMIFTWFIYKYVNMCIYIHISYIHINCQYQLNHIIIISLESHHLPFPPPTPLP